VDPAALLELQAVVLQQFSDLIETAGLVPLLAGQPTKLRLKHPQRPLRLLHVSPVNSGRRLERRAPHARVLVVELAELTPAEDDVPIVPGVLKELFGRLSASVVKRARIAPSL
jgi:hypothetical protein